MNDMFVMRLGTHVVTISGKEYSGDRIVEEPHLELDPQIMKALGWGLNTYLLGRVDSAGRLTIDIDRERYEREKQAAILNKRNAIVDGQNEIKKKQIELKKLQEELKKLVS